MNEQWWLTVGREARIAWVREKAAEGLSGAQIAAIVHQSRNAVMGLCNRATPKITLHGARGGNVRVEGVRPSTPRHGAQPQPARPRAPFNRPSGPAKSEWKPKVEPAPIHVGVPVGTLATLATLKSDVCHFPMFADARRHPDPESLDYCGHPVKKGRPYCEYHCGRMYQPRPGTPKEPYTDSPSPRTVPGSLRFGRQAR